MNDEEEALFADLDIGGQGVLLNYFGNLEELTIPDSVCYIHHRAFGGIGFSKVRLSPNIDTIDGYTFSGCRRLQSIDIANVTDIYDYGFGDCEKLQDIDLSKVKVIGEGAFAGCLSLNNINLSSVTKIGPLAFQMCESLESVFISKNVIEIGAGAFSECKNLTKIEVDENNPYYSSENGCLYNKEKTKILFMAESKVKGNDNDLLLPSGVTEIGDNIFQGNSNLKNIIIPDGVRLIGKEAFANQENLESVFIPDSVESIGSCAFRHCKNLKNINIPNHITEIENGVFFDCASLENLVIPSMVTIIGGSAFGDCSSLSSINIPESVNVIDSYAFQGCSSLKSIVIPESVLHVKNWAFAFCSNLSSLTINGSPKMEDEVFHSCDKLKEFNFSENSYNNNFHIDENWLDIEKIKEYVECFPVKLLSKTLKKALFTFMAEKIINDTENKIDDQVKQEWLSYMKSSKNNDYMRDAILSNSCVIDLMIQEKLFSEKDIEILTQMAGEKNLKEVVEKLQNYVMADIV